MAETFPTEDELAAKVEALAQEWDEIVEDEGYSLITRSTYADHSARLRALLPKPRRRRRDASDRTTPEGEWP